MEGTVWTFNILFESSPFIPQVISNILICNTIKWTYFWLQLQHITSRCVISTHVEYIIRHKIHIQFHHYSPRFIFRLLKVFACWVCFCLASGNRLGGKWVVFLVWYFKWRDVYVVCACDCLHLLVRVYNGVRLCFI